MKDSHIYLFKNFGGIDLIAGFVNTKEQFIKNSFVDEHHILFGLSENLIFRKEILFRKVKENLIPNNEYSVHDFTIIFSKELKSIYDYKLKFQEELSWLEIFQIAIIIREKTITDNKIEEAILRLKSFKNFIQEKY
ncbi:hypothetical protein GW796_07290 [archaeon]|nr:hypothetical protein [archaeon]NCQ51687.1 hypothetical protein [archaeon]